jgi:hypothetical protein
VPGPFSKGWNHPHQGEEQQFYRKKGVEKIARKTPIEIFFGKTRKVYAIRLGAVAQG